MSLRLVEVVPKEQSSALAVGQRKEGTLCLVPLWDIWFEMGRLKRDVIKGEGTTDHITVPLFVPDFPAIGDFGAAFSQATLENWQSEFLQLFSFTVMSALLIHKGSAESRDSDDRIEAALKRLEDRLGTGLTLVDPQPVRQGRDLHVIPSSFEGWALMDESSSEPEGYYDKQDEVVDAGRELARERRVALLIHGNDGKVRESTGETES